MAGRNHRRLPQLWSLQLIGGIEYLPMDIDTASGIKAGVRLCLHLRTLHLNLLHLWPGFDGSWSGRKVEGLAPHAC